MGMVYWLVRWLAALGGLANVALGSSGALMLTWALTFWSDYQPWTAVLATVITILLAFVVAGQVFVPRPGKCWPPWWVWFRNPLRKVSWRFGCVVQVHNLPLRGFVVAEFTTLFKVNRGRITPKRLFLESATGKEIQLAILCGANRLRADQISYIPAGDWIRCYGRILKDEKAADDGKTNHPSREEFFRLYDDLTLVFEYDDREFRKRFSRTDIRRMIDLNISSQSPSPARQPVLKKGADSRPPHAETADGARQLSPEQMHTFVERLQQSGFSASLAENPIGIRYAANCSECKNYAAQLADALTRSGWYGEISTTLDERPEQEMTGLRLYLEDMDAKPAIANKLAGALRAAQIDFDWWQNQSLGGYVLLFVYPQRGA